MAQPQNVIIKEHGPFYDQPHWVEDYYQAVAATGGSSHARFTYGPVTDYIRHRHNFPSEAAGVVLTYSDPWEPLSGHVSGFILDQEQYERFTAFVHNGYRSPDKNNFVLIDNLVATIVHNDLFANPTGTLDELYNLIRQTVYQHRPHSGPDDVWVDAIIDRLYEDGLIPEDRARSDVDHLFRQTFQNFVYGYQPRPEPTSSFLETLASELASAGFKPQTADAPDLGQVVSAAAAKAPCSPWLQEPPASPLRHASATISELRETLYNEGYLSYADYSSDQLAATLEHIVYRRQT